LSVPTSIPTSFATAYAAALSGGSNRATARFLNVCPYLATDLIHRLPPGSWFYGGDNYWDARGYLEALLAFRAVPLRQGPLEQKFKEMIFIAINAATTHLHGRGVRRHIQNVLKAGATKAEILEVTQLTTIMGIHSMSLAAPILHEEVAIFERQA
jgi:alkylhydroperoxidase/carboxymuconolactone decarboxylase family protein YurZ